MLTSQIHKPLYFLVKRTLGIVKVSCLLLTVSVLLSACSTQTQTDEPKWTDFYEVKQYEIKTETYTNEIITTVFISKYTETNKVIATQKEVEDFGRYEFEYSETNTKDFVDSETPSDHTQIELQCVDGSCEVKEK